MWLFHGLGLSGSRFYRARVFQGPGFPGSMVFQDLGFIGSGFFRVQVFLGPGAKSRSRVWVQILEVAKFMLYDAMRLEIDTWITFYTVVSPLRVFENFKSEIVLSFVLTSVIK